MKNKINSLLLVFIDPLDKLSKKLIHYIIDFQLLSIVIVKLMILLFLVLIK